MSFPQNTSNAVLVDFLKKVGHIKNDRVEQVMLSVDRADFCPQNSYQDCPQQIGYSATISAPHIVIILFYVHFRFARFIVHYYLKE